MKPAHLVRTACVLPAMLILAGCTAQRGTGTVIATTTITRTLTRAAPKPTPAPTAALNAGPITAVTATACPRIAQQRVSDAVGMRLARITVLRSGGMVVGCRFYALQDSALATSEKLPGPNQPVVEFVTATYPSALAAHNALVRAAANGTGAIQADIAQGNTGVAFQTTFDPADRGKDWVCAFNVDARLVTIRTAVSDTSYDAVALGKALEPTYTG